MVPHRQGDKKERELGSRVIILTFFTIRRNLLPLSLDIVSWTLRKGMFIKHSLCSSKDYIVWHAHEAEIVVSFTNTEVNHQLRLGR